MSLRDYFGSSFFDIGKGKGMALATQELYIDFSYQDIKVVASVSQYEKNARQFIVHLCDNGSEIELDPEIHELKLAMMKPDGFPVLNDITINDDGTALLVFDENMCISGGIAEMQFLLKNLEDESWSRTFKFKVKVNEAVYDDSAVTPTYEFSTLTNLIDQAEEAIERINNNHIIVVSSTEPTYEYMKVNDEWLVEY